MTSAQPQNSADVNALVEARLAAASSAPGLQETVTIEWRGTPLAIPVIQMPVDALHYNPATHRIRAQRTMDAALDRELDSSPYSAESQAYLHKLLMGDPADPNREDSRFTLLKEDLRDHGQNEPGIISRQGVLINGNTRRAALRELGEQHIRVGVLPPDTALEDIQAVELALQLRKDHKRDYSFINWLLAIDERVAAGQTPAKIQSEFRIKATTFERSRWILSLVREAIKRSRTILESGEPTQLRLVDFETHQGKLEELYTAHESAKRSSPDEAEALRESRLLALILDKAKTDLRLVGSDFVGRFMPTHLSATTAAAPVRIPGTSIAAPAESDQVRALRALTTKVLQARAVTSAPLSATPSAITSAHSELKSVESALERGLELAGKDVRVRQRRLAAAERIADACDDLRSAVDAVAEARAANQFDADALDDSLVSLRETLSKLAIIIAREPNRTGEGLAWLEAVGALLMPDEQS
jgi:hypothetical protein